MAVTAYPSGDNAITPAQYARDLASRWAGDGIEAEPGEDDCEAYLSGNEWRVTPGRILIAGGIVVHIDEIEEGTFGEAGPMQFYLVARVDFGEPTLTPTIVAKAGSAGAYPSVANSFTGLYEFVLGGFIKSAGGAMSREFSARTYVKPPSLSVADHTKVARPDVGQEVYEYPTGYRWLRESSGWANITPGAVPWTDYTPSFTAETTNPNVGAGFRIGSYARIGRLIIGRFKLQFGTGFSVGSGAYYVGMPVEMAELGDEVNTLIGSVFFYYQSGTFTTGVLISNTSGLTMQMRGPNNLICYSNAPYAWKVGSAIQGSFMYEAATD